MQTSILPAPLRVDVWLFEPERVLGSKVLELEARLDEEERRRASAFRRWIDRCAFVGRRVVLKRLLSRHLGCCWEAVRLSIDSLGKPQLNHEQRGPGLHFSLSGSGNIAAIALCHGRSVGVDIERIDSALDYEPVALQVLHDAELQVLRAGETANRRESFYEFWVRKEAFLKAVGTGFLKDPRTCAVHEPLAPGIYRVREAGLVLPWCVRELLALPSFKLAICTTDLDAQTPISLNHIPYEPLHEYRP